jgi:hypothetical protein
MSRQIAFECARAVLEVALEPSVDPGFGLAVDFHLFGMPICVSSTSRVPRQFDSTLLTKFL